MELHEKASRVRDGEFPVYLNPGWRDGPPFGVIDLGPEANGGYPTLHIQSDEDADRLIRALVRVKELRAALTPPCGCGHPKDSHWEYSEPDGPRRGCGYLGCTCTAYTPAARDWRAEIDAAIARDKAAAVLAASIDAGTTLITDDDAYCEAPDDDGRLHCSLRPGHGGGHRFPDPGDLETCGLPVWGDDERHCTLAAGHDKLPGCGGRDTEPPVHAGEGITGLHWDHLGSWGGAS